PTGMYEYLSPWSIYDFGFAASCMADEDRLFTCDSMSSYYVLERTGKTELDASNVTGYYEFKHWDFGMPEVDKFLDDITVVSWTTGNPIVFKTLFAGDGWSETSTFSISKQGALWYDPTQAEPDRWGPSSRIPPSRWGGPSVNPYHTDYEQEMVGTYIGWRMELDKDGYVNSFVHAQIFTEAGNYS
ncbi:MAG: hypothetical protein U9Q07_05465, partial [Planctomycetota bacterium]|nr:hypothetical protein [Planctomycetota bacterium]